MIKSSFNQISNSQNPYQGKGEKVLCVCSAGLLRSPTIAHVLAMKGYNTRAVGMSTEYALIPISTALLHWADKIVVVAEQEKSLLEKMSVLEDWLVKKFKDKITVLDIPDSYRRMDPELVKIIEEDLKDW